MKLYCFTVILFIGLISCKKENKKNINTLSERPHTSISGSNSYTDTVTSHDKQKKHIDHHVNKDSTINHTHNKNNRSDSAAKERKNEIKIAGIKSDKKAVKDSLNKYYIYLSLDDGPQLPGTYNCKHILEKYNVKATFFMIGVHNTGVVREKLVDSINNNPLFIVCNHSDTHANNKYSLFYKNAKNALQDFIKAESKLNLKHKIARLPGRNTWSVNHQIKGESSAFSVAKKLDSIGYSVYGWDLEWRFVHSNIPVESATEMIKKVKNTLKSGRTHSPNSIVILVHDRMFDKPQYADSLQKFISALKNDKQYIFETLDNYPVLSHERVK